MYMLKIVTFFVFSYALFNSYVCADNPYWIYALVGFIYFIIMMFLCERKERTQYILWHLGFYAAWCLVGTLIVQEVLSALYFSIKSFILEPSKIDY